MKIIKYKKSTNNKYKVYLDNDTDLSLYEEVILKYELLLKKEIDLDILDEINKHNQECEVYYVALNNIKNRFKSIYDLKTTLLKKEYPFELVELAIEKLIKQGYLNDRLYAKSYINNQIVTTTKGPKKIELELRISKVDSNIIDEEIIVFDEETQIKKIDKIVNKMIRSNRTRGGSVLKRKIVNDLNVLGYETDIIMSVVSNYDFSNNEDIVKKEYDKLYKKLSKKYSGTELEYKIKEKLYQKGLYYEN